MGTFDLLAGLELEIEGYALQPLSAHFTSGEVRDTTLLTLRGGGLEGQGEDVVYDRDEQAAFQRAGAVQQLAGRWSLGDFCAHIESLDLFPAPPAWEFSRRFRVWTFHSAALDLALRQNGRSLAGALGREPAPMRYVASTGLGEPPSLDAVSRRLAVDPTLRFKLDASSAWDEGLIAELVATGAVDTVDFKGHYRGVTAVGQAPDAALYARVAAAFPEAWLEDPDLDTPETGAALAGEHHRITWDAPIHSIADIEALPFAPRMVNLKPSRIGSLRELCAAYDYCAAHGIAAYGGGQTELGVGRGQAQYLAALFHPAAPNDLAPSEYNRPDPPAGLPRSPLTADLSAPGFRWPGQAGAVL